MTKTTDITLIGGGVIGLLIAREFIKAGATVTIIEKNKIGQESSWAGGGILLPLYPWRQSPAISALVLQSLKLYPNLADELIDETAIDPEWDPCGLLIVKNPDLDRAIDWCIKYGIGYQAADESFFKTLSTTSQQALWLPEIAQARNPRLVKSLKQYSINMGVNLLENCELTGVDRKDGRVSSIRTSSGRVNVNQLIVTAGAWTGGLFRQFFPLAGDTDPKIDPVKGQMLLFEADTDTLNFMVLDGDRYLIPRRDGKILAGSTVERDAFNKTATPEAKELLYDFAVGLLPSLKNFPVVKHWAGLRPGTENGIPYIDRHPNIENLWLNAGHFRNGLAMGPASAQLLSDLILGRPTAVSVEPYKLNADH